MADGNAASHEQEATFELGWVAREPPLVAVALWVTGRPARRLTTWLVEDPRRHRLRGVVVTAGLEHGLLLTGTTEDLPWIDGARYLGRSPAAPSLLLPTAAMPDVPEMLVERACRRLAAPVALVPPHWPGGPARVSMAAARTPDSEVLRELLDAGEPA